MKIRVAYVIDSLRRGGAEQLVLTTVQHLDRSRFEPVVIALASPLDLSGEFERAGVEVHVAGLVSPLDLRVVFRLFRIFRRVRPDLIHTHLRLSNVYGRLAAVLAGVPAVVTSFHHLDYSYWPALTWRARMWKQLDKWSARLVNRGFIAVSEAVRTDYARHFGLSDIKLVYNYLDLERFYPPSPEERRTSRARLGVADEDFVVLNVARLSWEKGHRALLQAVAAVRQRAPHLQLFLMGDGPDRSGLQALASELGITDTVRFLGSGRDVEAVLAAADLFVFPSLGEGLGIALMEAMAMGLPSVGTRVDGISELVQDGLDGVLVPANDPDALARSILALCGNPILRDALGSEARRTAARRFAAGAGVRVLETAYGDVLTGRVATTTGDVTA